MSEFITIHLLQLLLIPSTSFTPQVLSNLRNYRDSDHKPKPGWTAKKELIRFQELHIEVTLYWKTTHDPADQRVPSSSIPIDENFSFSDSEPESDLPKDINLPPLGKWYCLSSFIVLSTIDDDAIPEHHVKTIQSSIQMAVAEINCAIPVFLRIMHKKANMFLGVSDEDLIRTHYDMIYLRTLPANYKCFTGLHEIFKGKVNLCSEPIEVAVGLCFSTNELKDFTVMPPKLTEEVELAYPFGIDTDPVKNFILNCVWPEQSTSWVMHNYTNFNVTKAKSWILQCEFDDNSIEMLADFLEEFTEDLHNEDGLLNDIEHEYAFQGSFGRAKQKWSKLRTGDKQDASHSTIPDDVVKNFLYYLFPDADDNTPREYEDMEKKKSVRANFHCHNFVSLTVIF